MMVRLEEIIGAPLVLEELKRSPYAAHGSKRRAFVNVYRSELFENLCCEKP